MKLNQGYKNQGEDPSAWISREVEAYRETHPGRKPIRLDTEEGAQPLCNRAVAAMQAAVAQMGCKATFQGYGPAEGRGFLREALAGCYGDQGAQVEGEEVFVTAGLRAGLSALLRLAEPGSRVLVPDPGRPFLSRLCALLGLEAVPVRGSRENGFLPLPDPAIQADVICLSSPANPAGAAYSREGLQAWVDYAREQDALLLFDASCASFVRDGVPRSILSIEGARECAAEVGSLSQMAGFTGEPCGWVVLPRELEREGMPLAGLWRRSLPLQAGGVSYVTQRGAEGALSPAGLAQLAENRAIYRESMRTLAAGMKELGIWHMGGEDSPYLWMACPAGRSSREMARWLLEETGVAAMPGDAFGPAGEGHLRLSAFADRAAVEIAVKRMSAFWKNNL